MPICKIYYSETNWKKCILLKLQFGLPRVIEWRFPAKYIFLWKTAAITIHVLKCTTRNSLVFNSGFYLKTHRRFNKYSLWPVSGQALLCLEIHITMRGLNNFPHHPQGGVWGWSCWLPPHPGISFLRPKSPFSAETCWKGPLSCSGTCTLKLPLPSDLVWPLCFYSITALWSIQLCKPQPLTIPLPKRS